MDDMREIVTLAQVEAVFRAVAVAGPLVGIVVGALRGRTRPPAAQQALRGLAVGFLGTANYALWRLYLAITDRLGMDTVRNLLVNIVLFVLIGASSGLVVRLLSVRGKAGGSD